MVGKDMKRKFEKTDRKDNRENRLEINIVPLLMYLLKRLWVILLVGIVVGAMGFVGTKLFVQPTYKCSFTAYVNNKKAATNPDFLNSSDVSAAKQLVLTYSQIFRSNRILASADETMDLNLNVKKLKSMIGTEIQDETEIIQVYAISHSPEEAYKVALAVASVSPKMMADIIEGSSMKIVEDPEPPDSIYKPNYTRYTLLFFGGGALLTIIVLLIMFFKNDTVTNEEELENYFDVPILGVIPDTNSASGGKSGYYYNYYYEKDNQKENNDSGKGGQDHEKA